VILKKFVEDALVYELNNDIKLKTIEIRRDFKLKLPDAIIAASAIIGDHIVISRNLSDFNKIPKLRVIDPFMV